MFFLKSSASFSSRSSYDAYVLRRLSRARFTDLARPLDQVHRALKAAEDQVEERDRDVSAALADRDYADDRIDRTAREVKTIEGGLALGAVNTPVFKMLFPDGIGPIVFADVKDQVVVYTEFAQRLRKAADTRPERADVATVLEGQLTDWEAAQKAVLLARGVLKLARVDRDALRAKWDKAVVDIHANLVIRLGKDEAALFFPRSPKGTAEAEPEVEVPAEAADPAPEPPAAPVVNAS